MNRVETTRKLIDSHGRQIRKLRVSLLDACNFRCFYCMPVDTQFMNSSRWLLVDEIENICSTLCDHGLEQIRITGGEPTLRKDFREIVTRLSALPVDKLGLTTNGFLLKKELKFLQGTRCQHINISLDSLKRDRFNEITRKEAFDEVMEALLSAKEMGFPVKVNTVLMKGVNDDEIFDFIDFSAKYQIEVRFLELMKIGQACGPQDKLFISAAEAIDRIKERESLEVEQMEKDSTSFNFQTRSGARIGFIASESQPFCGSCSRWRLSADGFLRACLMSNQGVNFRGVKEIGCENLFSQVLEMKPTGRIDHVREDMNRIGG